MQRKRKVNFFRLLLFVCLIGYAVWVFIAQQIDINKNKQAEAALDKQIQSEEFREEGLEHEKKQVGTPEYMKKQARRHGMVEPDETIYVDALK